MADINLHDDDDIEVLKKQLSSRACNVVHHTMCRTVGELRAYSLDELSRFYNCGKKVQREIGEAIGAPWATSIEFPKARSSLTEFLREIPIEELLGELARRAEEIRALRKVSKAVRAKVASEDG